MRAYIHNGKQKAGHVCSITGQVYKGLKNVGRIDKNGYIYDGLRRVGHVTADGKVFHQMRHVATLNRKGQVMVSGHKVGAIAPYKSSAVLQQAGAALLVLLNDNH
ncbi:MAG: hypothetical protein ACPG7F_10460 [Aggregatilineales bacterium]